MSARGPVLFLCPHNAAKSVLAVAEYDRLAQQRGISLRADSAGTEPEAAPSPAVVAALRRKASTSRVTSSMVIQISIN